MQFKDTIANMVKTLIWNSKQNLVEEVWKVEGWFKTENNGVNFVTKHAPYIKW